MGLGGVGWETASTPLGCPAEGGGGWGIGWLHAMRSDSFWHKRRNCTECTIKDLVDTVRLDWKTLWIGNRVPQKRAFKSDQEEKTVHYFLGTSWLKIPWRNALGQISIDHVKRSQFQISYLKLFVVVKTAVHVDIKNCQNPTLIQPNSKQVKATRVEVNI